MTLTVFLGSLTLLMAIGMPIAFALILTGVALMIHLDFFDAQIVAQNLLSGADNFPLMAVPFFILANKYGLSGAQPQEVFDQALAQVATEAQAK